jgi:hypothetical protein
MQLKILAGIALGVLTGCSHEFRDQFQKSDYRLPFRERLVQEVAAPIIVSGRLLEVSAIGRPQRSPGDARIKTQLTKIKIDVEEVVKGSIRANPLEFYYFTYSTEDQGDLGVPFYLPSVGQHRIFFLKPYHSTYRSVGDVTNFTLPVRTGSHPDGFCQGKKPGCCIGEMLLIPEQDLDTERFAQDLVYAEAAAEVLCSPDVARSLLKQLTKNPDKRISERANEILLAYQRQTAEADRRNKGK